MASKILSGLHRKQEEIMCTYDSESFSDSIFQNLEFLPIPEISTLPNAEFHVQGNFLQSSGGIREAGNNVEVYLFLTASFAERS